ncbi:hypothetical protein GCM10019017_63600 [Streptomyces showdoensis]
MTGASMVMAGTARVVGADRPRGAGGGCGFAVARATGRGAGRGALLGLGSPGAAAGAATPCAAGPAARAGPSGSPSWAHQTPPITRVRVTATVLASLRSRR